MKAPLLATLITLFCSYANATTLNLSHSQSHKRYEFGLKILKSALNSINVKVNLKKLENVNEGRTNLLLESGDVDFIFLSTNREREKKFHPIKIPVYNGLLGCRLLLVPKKSKDRFKNVKSVADLAPFIAGHGRHWGDRHIYKANNLKVMTSVRYPLIFQQLIAGRIDYFHRGVSEIWSELEDYSDTLAIANGPALFYKHPVYFFVAKDKHKLAALIEKGLSSIKKSGEFDRVFLEYHGDFIKKANLPQRNFVILKNNPILPDKSPLLDTKSWLGKKRQRILRDLNL